MTFGVEQNENCVSVWLPDGENFLKICLFVSTEYTNVTDGRMDRQTNTAWWHATFAWHRAATSMSSMFNSRDARYQEISNDTVIPNTVPVIRHAAIFHEIFSLKQSQRTLYSIHSFNGLIIHIITKLYSTYSPYTVNTLHKTSVVWIVIIHCAQKNHQLLFSCITLRKSNQFEW